MTRFLDNLKAALSPAYELGEELMGAGMSRVFRATEISLGRNVVVKVLPPELAAGVNRDRFRREIQLAAQLQHPHIVPLLAAGEYGDLLYYTMPYVDGESLRARLERQGSLPVRDVLRLLADIVDALAYAHARGVVHRDIKPGNILTQGSHALVTDFGVAKALSAAMPMPSGATSSGFAIGTPAYMAPEQLAADPAADHRVDLYAVGLLAYELLTGEAPFTGPSPAATLAAQLTRDPEPLDVRRPEVPQALASVIMRCLAKDPDHRPQTAEALLAALDEVPHAAVTTPTRAIPAAHSPARRRTALVFGGLAATAIGALIATGALNRNPAVDPGDVRIDGDSVIAGDTMAAIPLTGDPPSPPAAPSTPAEAARAAAPLTRADSLAIAAAVRRGVAAESTRAAREARTRGEFSIIDTDSLRRVLRGHFVDSIVQANLKKGGTFVGGDFAELERLRDFDVNVTTPGSGGNARAPTAAQQMVVIGRRRVAIVERNVARGTPELITFRRQLADSLRRAVSRDARFRVVSADSVARAYAQTGSAERAGEVLDAPVVVELQIAALPGDSALLVVNLHAADAPPGFARRAVVNPPGPASAMPGQLTSTVRESVAGLREMMGGPRVWRGPPPPAAPRTDR
jgi:serine/threonine-protein kinase